MEKDLIQIIYYTDPLCCWSWAFEPQWRRLRYEFGHKIQWSYRMCGLVPDWHNYNDPLNSVTRPAQMGPVWMEAMHMSGMPINYEIWVENPPSSSYPSCIAVKCAGLQSSEAEEWYLRYVREAVMLHKKNITAWDELTKLALKLGNDMPGLLDFEKFVEDMENKAGDEAFREDLQDASYHHINRYPSLMIKKTGKKTMLLTGYRPFSTLLDAFYHISPELESCRSQNDPEAYKAHWVGLTERELREIQSW